MMNISYGLTPPPFSPLGTVECKQWGSDHCLITLFPCVDFYTDWFLPRLCPSVSSGPLPIALPSQCLYGDSSWTLLCQVDLMHHFVLKALSTIMAHEVNIAWCHFSAAPTSSY